MAIFEKCAIYSLLPLIDGSTRSSCTLVLDASISQMNM